MWSWSMMSTRLTCDRGELPGLMVSIVIGLGFGGWAVHGAGWLMYQSSDVDPCHTPGSLKGAPAIGKRSGDGVKRARRQCRAVWLDTSCASLRP